MLAHMHEASHDLRPSPADSAAAKIIPKPDKAEKNLTANSPHPKIFNPKAESHQEPIVQPEAKESPILGIK